MDDGEGRVLLVSRDEATVRWVQGCAAGSGAGLAVVDDVATAASRWRQHPVVLLGADLAAAMARRRPPNREHVHLLGMAGEGPGGSDLSVEDAVTLGVASVIGPGTGRHELVLLLEAVADPRPPGRVVVVVPGSSGAGATTTAAALASVAARDRSVVLVLPDRFGPDPWLLLGGEPSSGLTWEEVARVRGAVAPLALRESLPRLGGVAVLAHAAGRPFGSGADGGASSGADGGADGGAGEVLAEVLRSARVAFDLVVVDACPRHPALLSPALASADRVWVVTRPRAVALATARARRPPVGEALRVLVRGSGVPDVLLDSTLGVGVDLRMRDDPRLDEALDVGAGPVFGRRTPLVGAARAILHDLEAR